MYLCACVRAWVGVCMCACNDHNQMNRSVLLGVDIPNKHSVSDKIYNFTTKNLIVKPCRQYITKKMEHFMQQLRILAVCHIKI